MANQSSNLQVAVGQSTQQRHSRPALEDLPRPPIHSGKVLWADRAGKYMGHRSGSLRSFVLHADNMAANNRKYLDHIHGERQHPDAPHRPAYMSARVLRRYFHRRSNTNSEPQAWQKRVHW